MVKMLTMTAKTTGFKFCLLLLFMLAYQVLEAKTVYVSDVVYVPLRGGQSTQHRIVHKGVKSGTSLELIEENTETNYSLVRTKNGVEGWIQNQYLSEKPIPLNQLANVTAQLARQKNEYNTTLSALQKLEDKHKLLLQENVELERIKGLSVDVVSVDKENIRLTEENRSLSDRFDQLARQNKLLETEKLFRWFMAGASTILLGLLFGFWFARRLYQSRHSSGWS